MTWSLVSSLETVVLLGKGILVPEVTIYQESYASSYVMAPA